MVHLTPKVLDVLAHGEEVERRKLRAELFFTHVRQCPGCMKSMLEAYAEWSGRDPDEPGFEDDAVAELRSRDPLLDES